MNSARLGIALTVLAITSTGCYGAIISNHVAHTQLLERASFDLNCDKEQLETRQLDEKATGVSGCGQRAVYIRLCKGQDDLTGDKKDCTWIRNSTDPDKSARAESE